MPKRANALNEYLNSKISLPVSIKNDPSIGCLVLLKALYGLNSYWWTLFDDDENIIIPSYSAILSLRFNYIFLLALINFLVFFIHLNLHLKFHVN